MQTASHWVWSFRAQVICNKCLPASLPHIELLINEYLIKYVDQKLLETACERGASQQILEFILMRTMPNWRNAAVSAARGGQLHVFQWMMERQDGRGPWRSQLVECFEEAAAHGHLDLLKWLHDRCVPSSCDPALYRAAASGHLAVVQWLHEHTNRPHESFSDATSAHILSNAAKNGHFQVVEWLYDHVKGASYTAAVVSAMSSAARSGHLRILQWLHGRKRCDTTCTQEIMNYAVIGGHFDVVKWLFCNCRKGCSPWGVMNAAENGDLDMLQWLDKHFNDRFDSSAMNEAAQGGHFEVVKWLHTHRPEGCTTRAMDVAAANGHLEIVQWLHVNRSEGCTQNAMNWATEMGHLDVMQWLHENRSLQNARSGMYFAARDGNLEIMKWLIENETGQCDNKLMETAAWHGHLDVVSYLDERTNQRAHQWGLGIAAKQGHMEALLVLGKHYYRDDTPEPSRFPFVVGKCFEKLLIQLSDQAAPPNSASWLKISNSLDQFHSAGFYSCVCVMLDAAMKRRYAKMARQFFQRRSDQEKRKYVVAARRVYQISVMRWMLENGAPFDVATAINISSTERLYDIERKNYTTYVEVMWWLKESDRVALVVEGLNDKNHHKLLLWVLQNTFFQLDSRLAIRRAIKSAPRDTIQWFFENLLAPAIRTWCFED